jgi:hypothetical protein
MEAAENITPSSENNNVVISQATPGLPTDNVSFADAFDANTRAEDQPRLSTKNVGEHRSLYVALDETRSDALSPSDLSQSPKKLKDGKSHFATLPDRTLNTDIRTLNLHLALRAKEIVACSEPMWEWVQEYQFKQPKPRFRSDSIEVALLGSTRAFKGDSSDLVKGAILEMTRFDFDQILINFQL